MTLKQIIAEANNKPNFQESCWYIVSELEKLIPDWDKRQSVIEQIEWLYGVKICY